MKMILGLAGTLVSANAEVPITRAPAMARMHTDKGAQRISNIPVPPRWMVVETKNKVTSKYFVLLEKVSQPLS